MESRKVKGWRARLEEELEAARSEVWAFGANSQGARARGAQLDFREKVGAVFEVSEAVPAVQRAVSRAARAVASGHLSEVAAKLADDRREAARVRSAQWYASRSQKQKRAIVEAARLRRQRPEVREIENRRAVERRAARTDERRASDAEYHAWYWREKVERMAVDQAERDEYLSMRKRAREKRAAALRADPVLAEAERAKRRAQTLAWREANRDKYLEAKRRQYLARKAREGGAG
jgi:hypothetical protein